MKVIEFIILLVIISTTTTNDLPEIKIILDTSNSSFSGTTDEVKITFRKYICIGERLSQDFKIDIVEIPLILNYKHNEIKTGSSNVYTFKGYRFKDISYVKQFTLEKSFEFYGFLINGLPFGFRYSNDWKLKGVRVLYNDIEVINTNPTNSESESVWLNKNNFWITYPDPNLEVPSDCGVCGC